LLRKRSILCFRFEGRELSVNERPRRRLMYGPDLKDCWATYSQIGCLCAGCGAGHRAAGHATAVQRQPDRPPKGGGLGLSASRRSHEHGVRSSALLLRVCGMCQEPHRSGGVNMTPAPRTTIVRRQSSLTRLAPRAGSHTGGSAGRRRPRRSQNDAG
jgi:hypothetical protein